MGRQFLLLVVTPLVSLAQLAVHWSHGCHSPHRICLTTKWVIILRLYVTVWLYAGEQLIDYVHIHIVLYTGEQLIDYVHIHIVLYTGEHLIDYVHIHIVQYTGDHIIDYMYYGRNTSKGCRLWIFYIFWFDLFSKRAIFPRSMFDFYVKKEGNTVLMSFYHLCTTIRNREVKFSGARTDMILKYTDSQVWNILTLKSEIYWLSSLKYTDSQVWNILSLKCEIYWLSSVKYTDSQVWNILTLKCEIYWLSSVKLIRFL